MKAYKISCNDDDHGQVVVFAERARDVSKRQNSESCHCDWIDIRIERAPAFDKYAPGPVRIADYLAEGWQWTCQTCGTHLYADENPVIARDYVFCNRACVVKLFAEYSAIGPKAHDSIKRAIAAMWEALNSTVPE